LKNQWVRFDLRSDGIVRKEVGWNSEMCDPLTLVTHCGFGAIPLCKKGWPSAPARGGFGLDKGMAPNIVAHHAVNG
jgi:hypothetical protein